MQYQVKNIIIRVGEKTPLKKALAAKTRLKESDLGKYSLLRRSLDARQLNRLKYNFTVLLNTSARLKQNNDITPYIEPEPDPLPLKKISDQPIVVGTGPAGLFATLALCQQGFKPLVFERGDALPERQAKTHEFWNSGLLDENSNVQFGEGGAGTFSDGKLTSRSRNWYTTKVFEALVQHGADKAIMYEALPHLGTDALSKITLSLRTWLQQQGATFYFNSPLSDITVNNGQLKSVTIGGQTFNPQALILATGNAARDLYTLLAQKQVAMEAKPFAVGMRIEHRRQFIDHALFGERNRFDLTGPATYNLAKTIDGRGVYTFCMCPGGSVIGAASATNGVVVNGMSYSQRDGDFSNSALVAGVGPNDYGTGLLDCMLWQQQLEQAAFTLGGGGYLAPAQTAVGFMRNQQPKKIGHTTYRPSVRPANLNQLFSKTINQALTAALKAFDKRIPGFAANGVLIGVETRTSAPVRILRNPQTLASLNCSGLYPAGEGSGYSGGIISSAADGYRLGLSFGMKS